ncbi:DUF3558 domain-containing protein [Amycolatopsis rhizosphaerae]|uniref:DUF3558 domain-containing protein n=1 Tax=Amycolatopsis rhizosphaerae TaxID=2053003 RepID=UPI001FE3204E|nr:DUF3558 domain-containing protein [Amycolatopsis rhizosphaerae]
MLLIGGCSSHSVTPPVATGAGSGAASVSTGSSARLVPTVSSPLPVAVISKHPCDSALTDAQVKDLLGEISPRFHTDNQAGLLCQWQKQSTGATVAIGWLTGLKDGLNQVYANQKDDAYFQPSEIEGFPALVYDITDRKPDTNCAISIGIADKVAIDVGFTVGTNRSGKQNPCDAAKVIAGMVLDNLKAAAR